jgi:glycosyltransferase involved in cell wall biosynthesis
MKEGSVIGLGRDTETSRDSPTKRPRVACFTPLSPVASGISYYSEDLLPVLARAVDVDVFVDGYAPTEGAMLRAAGVRVRDGREFARAQRAAAYEAVIYQMGNSPAHAYMYDLALREPGIVVLHDVVLHHLRLWMAVNKGRARRREYAEDLARLYGPSGAELARAVLRGQTPATLFDYPLVEPVIDAARAVIVHNASSAERVQGLRPSARVRVVPMGVPLPQLPPRDEARERLGVAPEAFVVVSHGHVNPYKRLDVALRAFRRLLDERPDAQFLIAGSVAPQLATSLDRQVRYLGLGGRVRRTGFISPETVDDLLSAADCCVNLRYPSAGETSASLLRIMGAGLPVLVSDAGSFRELPDGCCAKIPVGLIEEALLAEYLIVLARDEALRASIGAAAREFVAEQHSMERSAQGYLDTLGEVLGRPLTLPEGSVRPAAITAMVGGVRPNMTVSLRRLIRIPGSAIRALRNPVASSDVSVSEQEDSPLAEDVATALAELRLAGHEGLERSVAHDLVALGLGAGEKRKRGARGQILRCAQSEVRSTNDEVRTKSF